MVAFMDLEFRPRGEGWRKGGRPRLVCPEPLLDRLRTARKRPDEYAAINVEGDPPREVRKVVSLLRVGAAALGWQLRIQHDEKEIRFYVEDAQ